MWKSWRTPRHLCGPWGLMAVRSPFLSSLLPCLQASFRSCLPILPDIGSKWDTPNLLLSPRLVFGATPPPSSPGTDLIRLKLTLGCNGGLQRRYVRCTVPWWKWQLNTGCDTLWERTWDVYTPWWFLWGRKQKYVCLSAYLSLCAEATARDGLVEIYITKHPQVHREISKIQIQAWTIKEWFQDVRGGERKGGMRRRRRLEGFLKASLVAHSESLTWKEGGLPFKDERGATLKVNWVLRYSRTASSLRNESAWCLQQNSKQEGGGWGCLRPQSCVLIKKAGRARFRSCYGRVFLQATVRCRALGDRVFDWVWVFLSS